MLGVDLGSKRIGVAVAESADMPALPLQTIEHRSRRRDVEMVAALARERNAAVIVVGYPLRLDGTRGPAAENVDRFVEMLRGAFDGTVVTVDERMTTGAATRKLQAANMSGRRSRSFVDRMAAVEILNSYLAGPPQTARGD